MPKHCLVSHRSPASNLKQAGACFPGLGSVFITSVVKLVTRQERRVWRDRRLLAGSPPAFPFYKRLQAFRKKTWASFLFRARFFSVSLQSSFADHRQVDLFCFPVTASALHSSGLGSSAAAQFDLRKEASEFASKQQKHPKKITKQKIQKKKKQERVPRRCEFVAQNQEAAHRHIALILYQNTCVYECTRNSRYQSTVSVETCQE